jgi:hypothetical protein
MTSLRAVLVFGMIGLASSAMAAENFFVRTLGGPDNDRVAAAVELGDVLYFAGVKDVTGLASNGLLLATTAQGDVLFERVFADPDGRPVHFTSMAKGNGLLYIGGTIGTWPTTGEAFVILMSSAGEVLNQTAFRNKKQARISDLIPTVDGGLLVVGSVVVPPDTIGDGWVAKLGAAGGIEWQREIGTGGNDAFTSAAERPEGGFVLAGGLGSDRDPFGTLQGWLLELDATGTLLWQAGYAAAVGDAFSDVILDRGGITAVGSFCEFCFFRGDGWIVYTDPVGNIRNAQFIGDFNFQGFDEIVAAEPAAKGQGFFVVGSTDTIIGPMQQMWAAQFDNRGALRWVRQIGGAGFEMAGAMAMLPSGSIAFGGYTVSDLNQDVYVGTVDRMGRNPSNCSEVSATAESAFRDDGGTTVQVPSTAVSTLASATVEPGSLQEVVTPTTVDRLVCFE